MKTAVKKNQQKKSKSWQHPKDFPSGPPPQYYPGPVVVNCTVLKSCGVFTTVWPPANIVGTQNPKSLQKKISALRRIRNLNPVSSGASPSFNSGSKFQRRFAEFQITFQISPALRRQNFSGASPSFKSESKFHRRFVKFHRRFADKISATLRRVSNQSPNFTGDSSDFKSDSEFHRRFAEIKKIKSDPQTPPIPKISNPKNPQNSPPGKAKLRRRQVKDQRSAGKGEGPVKRC